MGSVINAGADLLGVGPASKQADATKQAAQIGANASAAATASQERMFNQQVALQEPFRQAGITAQNRLLDLLGLSGAKTREQYRQELLPQYTHAPEQYTAPSGGGMFKDIARMAAGVLNQVPVVDENALNAEIDRRMAAVGTGADYGKYARDFSMADFQADPGYAFRLSEGQKALDRQAAARGGLISGGALKAAQRYGQEMGSQEYTNAFNRYQTNRANQLNPLQSLSGGGQTSTNTLSNAAGNYGTNMGNIALDQGATAGAAALAQGNIRASQYGTAGNALDTLWNNRKDISNWWNSPSSGTFNAQPDASGATSDQWWLK